MTKPKRIFISYSHDSDQHRDQVAGLSQRLRIDGLDAIIDQYVDGSPTNGWARWMQDNLDEAEFVLVICTETYYRRFRGHEQPDVGKGVDWEGTLITSEIYHSKSNTNKFVPVLFSSADCKFIPEPINSQTHYLLNEEARYNDLYDFLTRKPGLQPAALGEIKTMPPRDILPLQFASLPDTTTSKSDNTEPNKPQLTNFYRRTPDNQIALIDRTKQVDKFLSLTKITETKTPEPPTPTRNFGFLLTGHPNEWPDGFQLKLMYYFQQKQLPAPEIKILKNVELLEGMDGASYLWELIASAAENCQTNKEAIKTRLTSLQSSHVFIRTVASSTRERNPKFLADMLAAWVNLKLEPPAFNHYLILLRETDDNALSFWQKSILKKRTVRENLAEALKDKDVELVKYLLPELESPLPNEVKDWLNEHFDDQKEAIKKIIDNEIAKQFRKNGWCDQDVLKGLDDINIDRNSKLEQAKRANKETELRKKFGIPHGDLRNIIRNVLGKPEFNENFKPNGGN